MSASKVTSRYLSRRRHELYDRMIRVDHSGELGADRIYAGQMFVLRNDPKHAPIIQHMWDQEKVHLTLLEKYALKYRVKKSLLTPFWSGAGFCLGAGSALLGYRAAMACTVAVESVITQHYDSQIRELLSDDPKEHHTLIEALSKFRDDEQDHHDTGLEHDAQRAPAYRLLTSVIGNACQLAIKIAERI